MVTTWSKSAIKQLRAAYNYIKEDSPRNAAKVRDEIIALTIELPDKATIYPLDKYKIHNDGSYRAFELHRYRIIYRVL